MTSAYRKKKVKFVIEGYFWINSFDDDNLKTYSPYSVSTIAEKLEYAVRFNGRMSKGNGDEFEYDYHFLNGHDIIVNKIHVEKGESEIIKE